MNSSQAVESLAAIAHEHRLSIYRMLVEAGPQGLSAGTIAARRKLPPSSLTFHLQQLHRAGLIMQERRSRQLIYSADFAVMNDLVGYLTDECCAATGEVCATDRNPVRPVRTTKRRKAA
ncbi:MAG: ArsR/SmtB family transcription factor [Steroidobacteraceae bacterium]